MNSKGDDEVVIFVDAVHPTHAARPVGCWAPKEQKLAIEQTSGRERINIHGAIDLETGQTRMIEAETIDAISTIRLLESLESLYPLMVCIHVFLDNARYHHAKLVKEWLARPSCRIKLHFLPTYCPHLNPIERLWGVMHKNITHNKCYGTCGEFAETTLEFLRDEVPRRWAEFCNSVAGTRSACGWLVEPSSSMAPNAAATEIRYAPCTPSAAPARQCHERDGDAERPGIHVDRHRGGDLPPGKPVRDHFRHQHVQQHPAETGQLTPGQLRRPARRRPDVLRAEFR